MPIVILWVLPLSLWGGGVRRVFFIDFTCCAGLPLPTCLHPSESEVVYHGLSTRQEARPQGHAKSHSLPLPFLAFFMGYKSAGAQDNNVTRHLGGRIKAISRLQPQSTASDCHKMASNRLRPRIVISNIHKLNHVEADRISTHKSLAIYQNNPYTSGQRYL